MPRLLDDSEISEKLKRLPGWRHEGKFITKAFQFRDFVAAVEFVNRVAGVAEREEHHPDMHLRYATVTLAIQTHSEGGVTEWDIALAEAIEGPARGKGRWPRDTPGEGRVGDPLDSRE